MKRVLIFGDSNIWGFIPGSEFERLAWEKRISGIVQKEMGDDYRVLEEALNGRMTAWEDPLNPDKNSQKQLAFILDSHRPLDLLVLMLGTNDMKHYMNLTANDSALGISNLVDLTVAGNYGPENNAPEILIVSPPYIVDSPTPFGHIFDGAVEKSAKYPEAYLDIAKQKGCYFMNAGSVVDTPDRDGIHIDEKGHELLALAFVEKIKKILNKNSVSIKHRQPFKVVE